MYQRNKTNRSSIERTRAYSRKTQLQTGQSAEDFKRRFKIISPSVENHKAEISNILNGRHTKFCAKISKKHLTLEPMTEILTEFKLTWMC